MTDSLWGAVPAAPIISARATKPWYRPTFSPEHGVLLVLLGALLTGASLAQQWTWETTVAASAAFLAMQAEHPMVVQLKQRRQWRPRYVVWAMVYGGGAIALAGWLTYRHPVSLWLCGAAALAGVRDCTAVLRRRVNAIVTEIVLFASICLSSIFVYGTLTDEITRSAVGLWLLNSLFFASAVFTIKLRKVKTSGLTGSLVYHSIGIGLVGVLYGLGWLSGWTVLGFAIALLKLAVIVWQRDWYCNCRFEYIARFETYFALTYTAWVCLTLLPATLPPPT